MIEIPLIDHIIIGDKKYYSFREMGYLYKKGEVELAKSAFGIDLGTSNIKIYNRADDSIMIEKNMIAIENKKTLFAYGDSAF